MDKDSISRSITRLCHEIIEKNEYPEEIVLIGIYNRGVPMAKRIQSKIKELIGKVLDRGSIDITFYRDDFRDRLMVPEVKNTELSFSLNEKIVQELSEYSNRKEEIEVNLENQEILYGNKKINFEIDPAKKKRLLEGLDNIGLSLKKIPDIEKYENILKRNKPWI